MGWKSTQDDHWDVTEQVKQNLLEHGVVVEREIVLDHTVGDILGHLTLGHVMLGQVHSRKARAVDTGGELILVVGEVQGRADRATRARGADRGRVRVLVAGADDGEVSHLVNVRGDLAVGEAVELAVAVLVAAVGEIVVAVGFDNVGDGLCHVGRYRFTSLETHCEGRKKAKIF